MDLSELKALLKAEKLGVYIDQRGDKLALRAMVPQPGGNVAKQTRIALGVFANSAGFKMALSAARKLSADLALNNFSWADWRQGVDARGLDTRSKTVRHWVELFSADFATRRTVLPETWKKSYQEVFNRLDSDAPLDETEIVRVMLLTQPNSRQRKRFAIALQQLARFAGLSIDLAELSGKYSASAVDPRELPSDQEIIDTLKLVKNDGWKTIYARCATFGLRPHEAWYLVAEKVAYATRYRITQGKTGARVVYPLHPEWVEQLGALSDVLPRTRTDKGHEWLGHQTCKKFGKEGFNLPFKPYDLRHAYSRRGMEVGLQPDFMARAMGHSLSVHTSTYRAWVGQTVYDDIFRRAVARQGDRNVVVIDCPPD